VTRRLAAGLLVAATALAAGGCRDVADSTSTGGSTVSVYSLLPLQGPAAPVSRDIVDGEKLALRDAQGLVHKPTGDLTVNFRSVDSADAGRVTPGSAAAAARKAAQDPSAIAAVGAVGAGEAEVEIPLLNEASLALVTPSVTDLAIAQPRLYPTGEQGLARSVGDDASQATAVAALAKKLGCARPAILPGPSEGERLLAHAVGAATRSAPARGKPCTFLATDHIDAAVRQAKRVAPRTVIAPAALAVPAFAKALGSPAERAVHLVIPVPLAGAAVAQDFETTFGRRPMRQALLGYDAMRDVLAAVGRAGAHGNDRAAVARALAGRRVDRWADGTLRGGVLRVTSR
jgi:branched-chain amino acid transport system substrate-binding protein